MEKVLVFKTVFLLVALWTGGDGSDFYVFKEPKFVNKKECVLYVMERHKKLDLYISKEYKSFKIFRKKCART